MAVAISAECVSGAAAGQSTGEPSIHGRTPAPAFGKQKTPPLALVSANSTLESGDHGAITFRVARASRCQVQLEGPDSLLVKSARATVKDYGTWHWVASSTVHGGAWTARVSCESQGITHTVKAALLVGATRSNDTPIASRRSLSLSLSARAPQSTVALGIGGKGGGGYPNDDALCEWTGQQGHGQSCADYDWGYLLADGKWQLLSSRGFDYRNCTDYVAWALGLTWSSFKFPAGKGNAVDWEAYAGNAGLTVTHTPSVGDIAWWGATASNPYGHVALVTAVNGNGTVTVSQYNGDNDGDYGFGYNETANAYLQRAGPTTTTTSSTTTTTTTTSTPASTTAGYSETTGSVTNTWTDYATGGGSQGATIPANTTVQVACKVAGLAVSDGNTNWYRIASSPWDSSYYASADAFYNNGTTSGPLTNTPFVDPNVPPCPGTTTTSTSTTTTTTTTSTTTTPPAPPPTYAETVGSVAHTWTNYSDAGGTEGPSIASNETVQIACKVAGFKVSDGDTWWYEIASSPWDNAYYVSADAFYNNGQTSGSLIGTPFVDPAVPNC